MNDSITSMTLSDSTQSLPSSRLLGSASSDTRNGASQISRSYKQASHFFLQRRFPEAFLTIQPLLNAPKRKSLQDGDEEGNTSAPVARASRSNRVKVWSLYLTLVNAIVELGAEEGKNMFGNAIWRGMVAKVRDGSIWNEVVKIGYWGDEGSVDAEVVSNLATLLITHSPSQKVSQVRLETYLSASRAPNLDIHNLFENSYPEDGSRRKAAQTGGTDTPRDLQSRIKVIELYTLHVLPRNKEWDYAKEFITMSEILDEDRREDFLHTLESLAVQKQYDDEREADLLKEQEAEREHARAKAERRHAEDVKLEQQRQRQRQSKPDIVRTQTGSEKDYGIEDTGPTRSTRSSVSRGGSKPLARSRSSTQPPVTGTNATGLSGIFGKSAPMATIFRQTITHVKQFATLDTGVLLKCIFLVAALLVAVGRHDVRSALSRVSKASWDKLKRTVGVGVKVSYI